MLVVLRPKAVMISQDNITWMIQVEVLKSSNLRSIVWYLNEKVAQEVHQWRWKEEVWVSYLPLSHVAAQVFVFVFVFTLASVFVLVYCLVSTHQPCFS